MYPKFQLYLSPGVFPNVTLKYTKAATTCGTEYLGPK